MTDLVKLALRGRLAEGPFGYAIMARTLESEVIAVTDNSAPGEDERVPIFGSWPRIYTAVVVCAVVCMALIGLFSAWSY